MLNACVYCTIGSFRLESVRSSRDRHQQDLERVRNELDNIDDELQQLEDKAPMAAQRFRFYQELRGYVTDLVECLDEKVGLSFILRGHALCSIIQQTAFFFTLLVVKYFVGFYNEHIKIVTFYSS